MELYRRFKDAEGGRKVPLSPFWYVDLTNAFGVRVRVSTRCKDKRQAQLRAAELQQAHLDTAKQAKDGKQPITLANALDAYLARVEARRCASLKQVRTLHRKLLSTLDGDMWFHDLKVVHLETLKEQREREGKSAQTIAHELKVLRAAYNLAREKECYRVPEIVKWKLPTITRRTRYLSRDELNRLYEALALYPELQDLVLALMLTGGRWSEVKGLRWDQVDLGNGVLTIYAMKTHTARVVPIPAPALDMLKRRYAKRQGGDYVFPTKLGELRAGTSRRLYRVFATCGFNTPELVARHGRATIHSLRHTYASFLLQNGADLAEVQEALGHASVQMTRRYAHLSKSRTVERLRGIMASPGGLYGSDPYPLD